MDIEDHYWSDFIQGWPLEKYGDIIIVKMWKIDRLSSSDLWRDYR